MPKIDGIETLKKIVENNILTPVVMISGHGDIETAVHTLKIGAFDYIEKPLDLNRVLTCVRNALNNNHLRKENSILKRKDMDNLDYWDDLYVKYGSEIHNRREGYFKRLNEHFIDYKEKILEIVPDAYADIKDSSLSYEQGWDNSMMLSESIRNNREKDIILKHTTAGPHRCDIKFSSNNNILKDVSSMSTQVINGLLLVLSQAKVFHVEHSDKPIILIDDLFFGIDDKNLLLVINLLIDSEAQCFVTAPDLYKSKLEESINNNKKTRIYEFKGKDLKVVNSG